MCSYKAPKVSILCYRVSSLDYADKEHDDRDDKEDMDESAEHVEAEESEKPEDEKYGRYCCKHGCVYG
jgi:hypothetical protein